MSFNKEDFSEDQIEEMGKGFSNAYKLMKDDELRPMTKIEEPLITQIWKYLEEHPKRVYDATEGVCFPSSVILEALNKFIK